MAEYREAKKHLLAAVESLGAAYQGWVESEASYITRELEEAVEHLLAIVQEVPASDSCKELLEWIGRLKALWKSWVSEAEASGLVTVLPAAEFWPTVEAVCLAGVDAGRPRTRPLEAVADLRRQGVSDHQICTIYGWVDETGERQLWKVAEEAADAGKHSTRDPEWRNPLDRSREAKEAAERDCWQDTIDARQAKVRRLTAPCPESLENLVAQRVPLPQIAKMLHRTEDEILAECDAQGLPHPPGLDPLVGFRGQFEPEVPEAAARALDARAKAFRETADEEAVGAVATADGPAKTIEQEIVEHHLAGEIPEAIAKAVSRSSAKVTVAKIKAVLKRYAEDPEAFEGDR